MRELPIFFCRAHANRRRPDTGSALTPAGCRRPPAQQRNPARVGSAASSRESTLAHALPRNGLALPIGPAFEGRRVFERTAACGFSPGSCDEPRTCCGFHQTNQTNSALRIQRSVGAYAGISKSIEFRPLCTLFTSATAAPLHYPGRLRGTTLGRDLTTCALVPRSSPSGVLSPTGIAVIGTPLPDPPAAAAGAPEPAPDIAGVAM